MDESGRLTPPDFSKFVNEWYAHGAYLVFLSNGEARFDARVGVLCGPGVSPPCDRVLHGSLVLGYSERMQFSSVVGSTAYGTIISSNMHPKGLPVKVTLGPKGTLIYSDNKAVIRILCGPNFSVPECVSLAKGRREGKDRKET